MCGRLPWQALVSNLEQLTRFFPDNRERRFFSGTAPRGPDTWPRRGDDGRQERSLQRAAVCSQRHRYLRRYCLRISKPAIAAPATHQKGAECMICTCPKCAAEVLFDSSQIKKEGTSFTCPACRCSFWICAEATVRQASRQAVKVYCTTCGKKLHHLAVCSGCGLLLPEYFVVQWVKKGQKKQGIRSIPPGREEATNAISQKSALSVPKSIIAVAVALLALLVLGTALNQKKKAEQIFVANFIQVLYGVHTGSDLCLRQSAQLADNWEERMAAGLNIAPSIKLSDKSRLLYVKNETEENMGKIAAPPRKYVPVKDNLDKLYTTYRNLHVVTLNRPGSLPEFTAAIAQAERAYQLAAEQLKANLPEEMSAELKNAKNKYVSLRNF